MPYSSTIIEGILILISNPLQCYLNAAQPQYEMALVAVPATNADQNQQQTVVSLNEEKHGRKDSPLSTSTRLQAN
ncbi:unnamed protein product [Albugo candida]|uniref:Uncharacterized protein n=1 Tax=Albugo candida TaxID=65357 RepID=A0A024G3P3_9STRA|nr:unnamed protein product [Albugo candida]|eukprot:CCI41197.1 unnamed protein product [Albugo candida]